MKTFFGCLIMVFIGYLIGNQAEYEPAQVVDVVEVEVPTPVEVEVPTMPEPCTKAVTLAQEIIGLSDILSGNEGEQLALMSGARKSILLYEMDELVKFDAEQRVLSEDTFETYARLGRLDIALDSALESCDQAQQ